MARSAVTYVASEGAVALYLVACGLGVLSRRSGREAASVVWLLGAGAGLHSVAFVAMHRQTPPIPLESFPAALSLIGLLIVVAYLFSLGIARIRSMGVWVGAVAGGISLLADLGLRLRDPIAAAPVGGGAWSHAHVLLSAGGFSLLALTSLAGLGYLAKERQLKLKRGPHIALPSLEGLDRFEHLCLAVGYPLLTLGVVTGFAWSVDRHMDLWTGHALWTLGAWGVYLLPVSLRVVARQRGRMPARGVVLGFALLAVSYLGHRLLGSVA